MYTLPTIQNLSPSYVIKVLMLQPYGTFIIRSQTSNDKLISSIQINHRSRTSIEQHYVVIAVRVDGTVYKSPVMNYRLSYTEQNPAQLLEQYNSKRQQLGRLPLLQRELILSGATPNWTLDPKQLDHIDFNQSRFGGESSDGVSEGIWQKPEQEEIKIFVKRFAKTRRCFDQESTLLKQICFFPIITLYGEYADRKYNYLVFAHGGKSLHSTCPIQAQGNESQMLRLVRIAFQIANAMLYLEKKNIVHRDLTAGNVLIDDHGFIRIADFGHAIQKEEGKNNLTRSLTLNGENKFQMRFLAPECMQNTPSRSQNNDPSIHDQRHLYASFSSKSDVWAFGILLVQLMLEQPSQPYPLIRNDLDILRYIVIDREMHPRPYGCSTDIYCILQQCWAYEPIDRISFTEIREKMSMLISILG